MSMTTYVRPGRRQPGSFARLAREWLGNTGVPDQQVEDKVGKIIQSVGESQFLSTGRPLGSITRGSFNFEVSPNEPVFISDDHRFGHALPSFCGYREAELVRFDPWPGATAARAMLADDPRGLRPADRWELNAAMRTLEPFIFEDAEPGSPEPMRVLPFASLEEHNDAASGTTRISIAEYRDGSPELAYLQVDPRPPIIEYEFSELYFLVIYKNYKK